MNEQPEDAPPAPRFTAEEQATLSAIGAYTEHLRGALGLDQHEVAAELGVHKRTILRIDNGQQNTSLLTMLQYIARLGGSMDDLGQLAEMRVPTRADGEALAAARLARNRQPSTPAMRALLTRIADAAINDPGLPTRLDGYLDGLGLRGR